MFSLWWPLLVLIGASLLGACVITEPPLGQEEGAEGRPAGRYHTIVRGDTLYGIAFRYGLDYRALARSNGIRAPYRIYPGQRVVLGAVAKPRPAAAAPQKRPAVRAHREPSVAEKPAVAVAPRSATGRAAASSDLIRWQWPAQGRLQAIGMGSGKQGVEIVGEIGQAIRAAAAGQVVYSGDGLVGYGRLIIIKHDDTYFSAYAHNRRLLVREGISVSGGQPIAEMGSTGTNQVKLYFEIRRNGKPVPPRDYLPERQI
ncbi:MAG: peptidoglycan DD-metalloendopeptidase family protein [Pseudomonadota bacterium]|nr:peptidoglycan DD-metalloendopeptidase family protein [Pseudomonadota bacterium]